MAICLFIHERGSLQEALAIYRWFRPLLDPGRLGLIWCRTSLLREAIGTNDRVRSAAR